MKKQISNFFYKKRLRKIEKYVHAISTNKMPYWVDVPGLDGHVKVLENVLCIDNGSRQNEHALFLRLSYLIPALFSLCAGGFLIYALIFSKEYWLIKCVCFLPTLALLFIGVMLLLKFIYFPNKIFIFNRLDGTITMPNGFMNLQNKTVTALFDNTQFYYNGSLRGGTRIVHIDGPYTYSPKFLNGMIAARWLFMYNQETSTELHSLFTWFMDKNRPLPPGKIFDPYREADYERRKNEGFPEPIYSSSVL